MLFQGKMGLPCLHIMNLISYFREYLGTYIHPVWLNSPDKKNTKFISNAIWKTKKIKKIIYLIENKIIQIFIL